MNKDIILFVGYFISPESVVNELKEFFNGKIKIALIYDKNSLVNNNIKRKVKESSNFSDIVIEIDFSKDDIGLALAQYSNKVLGVLTKGESFLEEFKKVIEVLPDDVNKPSTESINKCSDKKLMREALFRYNSSLVPRFTEVNDSSESSVNEVSEKIGFPLIIKPSGLSTSMLVTKCVNKQDLAISLENIFNVIDSKWKEFKGRGWPIVLAEQFMDGDLVSVDAYVDKNGKAIFCPVMDITTGVKAGKEDYYGFMQISPSLLDSDSIKEIYEASQESINAVGLKNSSAHIELINTIDGWKIVEIGPRTGGQRGIVYWLSHGIKHNLNDVLTRIDRADDIDTGDFREYSCYVKLYAAKEGIVKSITGVESIKNIESFHSIKILANPGRKFVFARNGGLGVADLIMSNEDFSKLNADIIKADKLFKVYIQ